MQQLGCIRLVNVVLELGEQIEAQLELAEDLDEFGFVRKTRSHLEDGINKLVIHCGFLSEYDVHN